MGVIPHNQKYTEEMVSILEHLHQYYPTIKQEDDEEIYSPIPFGGDQLTVFRAINAKKVCITSRVNLLFVA